MTKELNRKSIKYQLLSFKYASRGIIHFYKSETKALIHSIAALAAITMAIIFHIVITEWILIVVVIGLVIFAEIFNTAIERITDLVSPEHHPLAGQAKDLAAGAVFITSLVALITGVIIFLPKIIEIIF